ncbi:MAG: FKBP-type peptidyl-prolyl cis-trans isomerase [Pseudomonadota bacterium]
MTRIASGLVAASLLAAPIASAEEPASLETPAERFSYAIGLRTAENMKQGGLDLDVFSPDAFAQALRDVMDGTDPRLTEDEMTAALTTIGAEIEAKEAAKAEALAADGVAFLEENKTAEGVTTTESGLQYRVDVKGDGPTPTASDTVEVHYSGRLLDGTQFDSSYDRGQPAQFPVGGVIPGWTEALQLMPVGSKYELWIPQELAYGERGAGGDIPPYAVLNFTVELLSIAGQ